MVSDDSPVWHCNECGKDWGRYDDPARYKKADLHRELISLRHGSIYSRFGI